MTGTEARRLAWAYLSGVLQGPCAAMNQFVDAVGVLDAAAAVRERELPKVLRNKTIARRDRVDPARDLEAVERVGGRLVTPDDEEWPAWRMLAFSVQNRPDDECGAPLCLWVVGESSLSAVTDRAIGVVGARAATGYGRHVTADIVGELAADGWTTVSGAAYGIDAAAHRAALAMQAPTVALLACGVDQVYPSSHARLLAAVAECGLLVSEYPPGTAVTKYRFLERNRLIAGLSEAVLVVEAGWRSGARNTAMWARRLGRPALAVPGPVTSALSTGCHQMIRDGQARLVTRASEVIDEAAPMCLPVTGESGPHRPTDALAGDMLRVYEAFPAIGSRGATELAETSGVPVESVCSAIPALVDAGFVGTDERGWYRKHRTET